MEPVTDGIWQINAEGLTTYANEAFARMVGWSAAELLGRPAVALLFEDDPDRLRVLLGQGGVARPSKRHQVALRRKDGSARWARCSAAPIHDAAGRHAGAAITVVKRSEGVEQAEALLRESDERYRALVEQAGEGIWLTDVDGKILEVNESACRALSYRRDELLARRLADIIHPDDRDPRAEDIALLKGGRTLVSQRRFQRRDGDYVVLEGTGRMINERHCLTVTRDVTEQRRAEEELVRTRQVFQRIAEATPDVVYIHDIIDDLNVYANRNITDVIGYTPQEVRALGTNFIREITHPDDLEGLVAAHRRHDGAADGEVVEHEFRARHVGGGYKWLRVRAVVFTREPEGRPRQILGVAQDVTARKKAEEERGALLSALELERARLTETLRKLTEADRRKDEFLAMLAHELRNPLSPILNAAELLRARLPGATEIERHRDIIERQARHLARMLDVLLDVSRVTRDRIELRRQAVELAPLVEEAVQASAALIKEARHELTVAIPPEPVRLDVDPTRMVQVLCNLLNNAAKYTPPRGRIAIAAAREGDHIAIRVRDTGSGITKELLPHVFDLFVQEERSLDRSQGGLGIGLTMVKRLVELHGGTVEAWSEGPDRGSELTVRLPVLQQEEGRGAPARAKDGGADGDAESAAPRSWTLARPSKRADAARAGSSLRILVVEDNMDAAETLSELLELWGHEVTAVNRGEVALAIDHELRADVVLLDIGLPGMDGYEVARRMRASYDGGRALLVALTGYGQPEDRERAREAGFDRHLTKPIEPEALQAILARIQLPAMQEERLVRATDAD